METILLDYVDGLATINLNRGKANPINHTMVKELSATLRNLSDSGDVRGVIISGKENFFSAGLDLPELYEYDKVEFPRFWRDFIQMIADLIMFKKPLVADITGHSPAGGTVIALGCDYKVMAAGNYKIGLNEIPVGIIVPQLIYEGYAFHLGHQRAYNYIMEGKLYSPDEALAIGLVDELAIPEQTYGVAVQAIERYLSFDQDAWRETKKNTKIAALKPYIQMSEEAMDIAMEQWWRPATREKMAAFIAGLKKK